MYVQIKTVFIVISQEHAKNVSQIIPFSQTKLARRQIVHFSTVHGVSLIPCSVIAAKKAIP